jgi:hypothetical protein
MDVPYTGTPRTAPRPARATPSKPPPAGTLPNAMSEGFREMGALRTGVKGKGGYRYRVDRNNIYATYPNGKEVTFPKELLGQPGGYGTPQNAARAIMRELIDIGEERGESVATIMGMDYNDLKKMNFVGASPPVDASTPVTLTDEERAVLRESHPELRLDTLTVENQRAWQRQAQKLLNEMPSQQLAAKTAGQRATPIPPTTGLSTDEASVLASEYPDLQLDTLPEETRQAWKNTAQQMLKSPVPSRDAATADFKLKPAAHAITDIRRGSMSADKHKAAQDAKAAGLQAHDELGQSIQTRAAQATSPERSWRDSIPESAREVCDGVRQRVPDSTRWTRQNANPQGPGGNPYPRGSLLAPQEAPLRRRPRQQRTQREAVRHARSGHAGTFRRAKKTAYEGSTYPRRVDSYYH